MSSSELSPGLSSLSGPPLYSCRGDARSGKQLNFSSRLLPGEICCRCCYCFSPPVLGLIHNLARADLQSREPVEDSDPGLVRGALQAVESACI